MLDAKQRFSVNNKLLLCLSLALASNLVKISAAPPTIETRENRTVENISIRIENLSEGTLFDPQSVLSKLRTHKGDPFSQYVFDQDLKTLAEEYDRVEPQIQVNNNEVNITLKIWLRPTIRVIEWSGNQYLKTKTLQKELDIKPGTTFNRTDFNKAFNKVKEYYIKKGYFESQLSYKISTDPKTREIDIHIQISEGRSGKVDDIVFHGFSKKEESDILDKLYTKKYSTLTSWFTGIGTFNEEALEQDRLSIFSYLQDEGYADARVNIQILESPAKGKIIIDISADKGILYHFGEVSFDGNILFTDEEIEKVFVARPDMLYSPDRLRKTSEAIKELYGRKGFIDTNITFETQLEQDAPLYNVHFQIDEGKEYRIGMLRVIGNVQTETRVILRESLLVPGETFDSLKLKVTQARLENMGYFKSVNVYAVRTQDDLSLGENYRDIYIEVDEKQTGNISLFSGFSSADNIFGGLDLTERNFNYKGISRLFSDGLSAVRGGGEFLHMRASFGAKQQSYLVSWLTPYFLDSLWRIGFEFTTILNSQLQSENYDINTYNLGVFVYYPLTTYWTYGVKYRIRNIDVEVDIKNNPQAEKQTERNNGILSGLGTTLSYDSTDSALKPHRGLRSLVEAELVGLGGHVSFFRTGFLNSFYTPLWRRGYMHYRGEFRFILPFGWSSSFNKIPLSERFFLGGVASVRGYRDFILGPRFKEKTPTGEKTIKKDPTGGISSSLLSIEYVQEMFSFLDAFAFIDAGYVSKRRFGLGTYRMSYGAGVTIDVLGRVPVTLGYGIPVNPKPGQTRHFFFSMGGQF